MGLRFGNAGYTYDEGTPLANPALTAIDAEFEVGRLTLVLGPTGSGKSTLLRLGAGLLIPTSGGVLLEGAPVTGPLAVTNDGVGLVFQSPETQLFADTLEADVSFGPLNQGCGDEEARTRARTALEAVGLDPETFGPRSPFTLSGGEARRAALAGILAMRPRFLLLDEPTAGLDARGRDRVMEVLDSLKDATGIAVVTHDAEEFLGVADDVLLLDEGSVRFSGTVAGLLDDPLRLEAAGLAVPGVVRTQLLARAAGAPLGQLTFDPEEAAAELVAARGRRA